MRRFTIIITVLLIVLSSGTYATTRNVTAGDSYSLQTQWNALEDNDVLYIPNGTYTIPSNGFLSNSDISGVEVRGESRSGVILDFDNKDGFNVSNCDIDFKNLTIKNVSGSKAIEVHWDYSAGAWNNSTVDLSNVRFESNTGGAIYYESFFFSETSPILIEDCEFIGNSSTDACAGVCIDIASENLTIQRNLFRGNSAASSNGCDISIAEISANVTIENNVFYSASGSPSVYLNGTASGKTLTIKNNTIAKNAAGGLKFGSSMSGYSMSFKNNMFADNTSYDISGSLTLSGDNNIVETVSGTSISGSNNDVGTSASYFYVQSDELKYTNYGADVALAKISSDFPSKDAYGEARDGKYCDIGGLNIPLDTLTLWTGAGNNHTWTNTSNWYRKVPANSTAYKRVDIFETTTSNYPIITSNTSLTNVRFKVKSKSILKNSTTMTCKSIRVKSDDDGDGQFIDAGAMTVSGSEVYEQKLLAGQWNFIGIPADVTANNLLPNHILNTDYWLAYYDGAARANVGKSETGENWKYINSGSYTLEAKKGYAIWVDNSITIEFTARPANINVALDENVGTRGPNDEGWNLLGNPYSITLETDDIRSANSSVAPGSVYFYEKSTNGYVSRPDGVGDALYIPAHQAFFVQAASSNNFSFPVAAAAYTLDYQFKSSEIKSFVRIEANDDRGNKDAAFVRVKSDATEFFDMKYDAYEFMTASDLLLYTELNNDVYSVNSIGLDQSKAEIPLRMKLSDGAKMFSFKIETEAFDDYRVALYDYSQNKLIPVEDGDSVVFDVEEGGDLSTRFDVRLYNDVVTFRDDANVFENVKFFTSDDGVKIAFNNSDLDNVSLNIVDVSGRIIHQGMVSMDAVFVPLSKPGLYLINVSDGTNTTSHKYVYHN